MFLYYQKKQGDTWGYVVESAAALENLKSEEVHMQSVLAIKEPIEDDDAEGKHGKIYKGPFYIDIDVEGDPEGAIASAQSFADRLEDLNVDIYAVYLSGQKGFHFIIPMTNFVPDRPVKSLPLIYKEMALEMYVEGVDLAVYNEGRPRLLRTPNVKRKDNKKYKVRITKDELYALTPELYGELSKGPRDDPELSAAKLSLKMQVIYETAKIRMQKKQKAIANLEFVPDEELKKTVQEDGTLPGCIRLLIEQGDTRSGSNFNQAAIQFAAYVVKAGVTDWLKHAKEMAKNVKSSSYNTDIARLGEIKKIVNYINGSRNYGFSKAMLFSVMEPCKDCAICNGTIEDGEVVPEDYEAISDIDETPYGYFTGFGKQKRQVTTFTLEMISKFSMPTEKEEEGETRVGTNANIRINGHRCERVTIPEDAWNSVREFKQVIKGKGNYAFYGNDTDLQKMQNKLFADQSHMTELSYVHSVGIHRHKIGNNTVLVYAEPGFSVSSTREKDTHQIWGSIPAPPNIKDCEYPAPSDDLKEFIERLLFCNEPLVTCTLIGWLCLCHIKVQLTMRDNQFPLLSLWGNAGSGKSSVAALFAHLHGVDYMLEHSPMSLQGTTPWAVAQYCTTSESTPRLIEEFNRGEIPNNKYDQFSGMFKAAWNKQTFAKGGVDKATIGGQVMSGAKVIEAQISAPLCVMSEQAPDRPALRQRMIQVNIKKSGREMLGAEENYYYVIDHRFHMFNLARAMVWKSLETHPEWVADTMESFKPVVPKEIDARPRFSYQAVLTGIKFFGETLTAIGLEPEWVDEKIGFMSNTVINNLSNTLDDLRVEKSRTEVSLVISEMANMADAYSSNGSTIPWTLEPGRHYIRTEEALYLDITVCHVMYTRWARSGGAKVIIGSLQQFEALLQQEEFFTEFTRHEDIADATRRLAKLDSKALMARGIDVHMFVEAG